MLFWPAPLRLASTGVDPTVPDSSPAVTRHYTPELANRSLPLVSRIVGDIQGLTERIAAVLADYPEDVEGLRREERDDRLEPLRDRWVELHRELEGLGVELKDPRTGLIDFRAMRQGEEVYLCWRLGEPSVGHWHPLHTGFAGRAPIDTF